MTPHLDESYESWSKRVGMFEQGHAMMQIARGEDTDLVLENMSRRITDKLLHPIFKAIRDCPSNFDAEKSAKEYHEKIKNRGLIADHVIDEDIV
jgi:glutamyl-tRNA reductase